MAGMNLPVAMADESFRSTAPEFVHPGMLLYFENRFYDVTNGFLNLEYELLSGPTNASSSIGWNRGTTLVIDWRVDAALLGTTAEFVIRTTVVASSFVTTNVVRIPVVAPPPIHSLVLSNNLPVLTVTNLPVALGYEIQTASSVTASNWVVLATTSYYSPYTRFVDLSATNQVARFYRLRPVTYTCYTSSCP